MNFMEKFNELANRTLVPIANKLGNQRHLAAIRDGMVVAIPLSILGGVCLIISTPPFKPETLPNWGFVSDMLNGWYNWAQANKAMLQLPYNMTMALMGLFIAFCNCLSFSRRIRNAKIKFSNRINCRIFNCICTNNFSSSIKSYC